MIWVPLCLGSWTGYSLNVLTHHPVLCSAPKVVVVSDFVLIHGNGEEPAGITKLVNKVRAMPSWQGKPMPIVFNEDDHGNLLTGSSKGR